MTTRFPRSKISALVARSIHLVVYTKHVIHQYCISIVLFLKSGLVICLSKFCGFTKCGVLFGCIRNTSNIYSNRYGTFSNQANMFFSYVLNFRLFALRTSSTFRKDASWSFSVFPNMMISSLILQHPSIPFKTLSKAFWSTVSTEVQAFASIHTFMGCEQWTWWYSEILCQAQVDDRPTKDQVCWNILFHSNLL